MATLRLHITGIVQGVGFRPHVYTLASRFRLKGWVLNASDGVHIEIQGTEDELHGFTMSLRNDPPGLAHITGWTVNRVDDVPYNDFTIRQSSEDTQNSVLLTPDYAICSECLEELHNSENRRFRYPFITCTKCGPRFSIIDSLPYDRERTAMDEFGMCDDCRLEYSDINDRRYFSQTNSCGNCGITLNYEDNQEKFEGNELVLARIQQDLRAGKILAVKGIGGYLLLCDATNELSIRLLRKRKSRPSKPFALLYRDVTMLSEDVVFTQDELNAFNSAEAPIILFKAKENPGNGIFLNHIAPGLDSIGVMRPYAPLLELISKDFGKPLIATSGNISGSPIIYDDQEAREALLWIADAVVGNNRRINIPQDDSVIKFTPGKNHRIVLRRSRGMAPNYFGPSVKTESPVLSFGASMKGTFALQHENIYISQYLGDQDSFETQKSYSAVLEHMMKMIDFKPAKVVVDLHPTYASTLLGKKMAKQFESPVIEVQHHEAHFMAVLAENGLIGSMEPLLGVVWDGTGLGTDQNIWGGEFFAYSGNQISRVGHFDYYDHILGDKMAREPRVAALSILSNTLEAASLKDKFTDQEWEYYNKILRKGSAIKTSSAGRLFDAAACLLGMGDLNTYEGENAVKLESLANRAQWQRPWPIESDLALSPQYHLLRMIHALRTGHSKEDVAWQFHAGLVEAIKQFAILKNFSQIAFSGGVFQNGLLVDLIITQMADKFSLYFHKELSPNDENISFGQLVHAQEILQKGVNRMAKTVTI